MKLLFLNTAFCSTLRKIYSKYFKDSPIKFVHEYDLLGIILSSKRTTDNVIEMQL